MLGCVEVGKDESPSCCGLVWLEGECLLGAHCFLSPPSAPQITCFPSNPHSHALLPAPHQCDMTSGKVGSSSGLRGKHVRAFKRGFITSSSNSSSHSYNKALSKEARKHGCSLVLPPSPTTTHTTQPATTTTDSLARLLLTHSATHTNVPFPPAPTRYYTDRPRARRRLQTPRRSCSSPTTLALQPSTPRMKVNEAFSLLGLSPSPPPDEGAVCGAFKELALPFLALGEGDTLRHTRLWELCQAYEVRVKHT